MKLPTGFKAAAGKAGIKASGKPDLALIYSTSPLHWALTSTENAVKAACVTRNRELYAAGNVIQGIVINSGNANCATGQQGIEDNKEMAVIAAQALGVPEAQRFLTASTGIIGHHLPVEKISAALPNLVDSLVADVDGAAAAMLTTDLVSKQAAATLPGGARVVGIAKGSGMIHPNMATMLAFVMTDARVSQDALREMWPRIVAQSFNQITVDGDTSPNDIALVMASQQLDADLGELEKVLLEVAQDLAQQIARDGEGATKLITVQVSGADSDVVARATARAVARSPLVKAAAHGNDPNWGRILIALGGSSPVEPQAVTIQLQDTAVYRGEPLDFDAEALSKAMDRPDLLIDIDLGSGKGCGTAWGCDLSREYVAINADYHT